MPDIKTIADKADIIVNGRAMAMQYFKTVGFSMTERLPEYLSS